MIGRLAAGLILAWAGPAGASGPDPDLDSLKKSFRTLAQEKDILERENRLLRLELDLVDRDSAYAIVDLKSGALRFKLRGVELRTYDLLDLTVKGDARAWPDSVRNVAGPLSITEKEDLGPPPVPIKPKPRSPLDVLPPDPVDPTPSYYNLCFNDDLILHVVPGDSTVSEGTWMKRVSKQAVEAFQKLKHRIGVALGWEAEDRRIHAFFRLPHAQAQAIFRAARIGTQAILIL
jgi:hypothetical protein